MKLNEIFEHTVSFTQEQVNAFAEVTEDRNPIHLDAEYAAETMFKRPIVHGFLAGAVFSKVFGTLFPGEGTIYLNQELSFKKPVYVDQEYVARFEVTEVKAEKHMAVVRCTLSDEGRAICIEGDALVMNKERID